MAQQAQGFHWHPEAQLYAGHAALAPQPRTAPQGFIAIPAQPTDHALQMLGQAMASGDSFCVHGGERPTGMAAQHPDFITLTGGSSGQPKAILRSQKSWVASFNINAALFEYHRADSIAVLGALSHSLALYGILEALHLGLNAHALDALSPTRQRQHLQAAKVSVLYATPTQLRLLGAGAKQQTLPDLRLVLCGGGALDANARAMVQALCPQAKIHVFYGAAETSFITLSGPDTPETSVGKPYPEVQLRILDPTGQATKGIGEVWVKSPYLFEHYMRGTSADTQWRDGFLSVGEMGQLDATGTLTLTGRKSRMISIADQNVYPEQIEAFITRLADNLPCAVLARPDPLRGHHLVAVVQAPADPDLGDQILRRCRAAFGALCAPKKLLFHPSLPLLGGGKVDLIQLAAWAEDQR
jgi:long-chain acyl-CoA synthetase